MTDQAFDFDAAYSDAIIDDAAKTFVRRLFKRYLGWLVAVCFLNIAGFVTVLKLPGTGNLLISLTGLLAVLCPLFLLLMYIRFPGKLAAGLKRGMKPSAHVSVRPSGFSMWVTGRSLTKEWTDLQAILEFPDYFLLVVAPFAFTFIPKKDMPVAAQQLIREASL